MARAFPALFIALPLSLAAQRPAAPAPTPGPPPGEWRTTGRDDALTRYSPLDQITTANVVQLRPVWSFSTGAIRAHEGNPLVVGSTLFLHTPYPNVVFALDLSRPGAPIKWRYSAPPPPRPRFRELPGGPRPCRPDGSMSAAAAWPGIRAAKFTCPC